jgi:hypothetical protein
MFGRRLEKSSPLHILPVTLPIVIRIQLYTAIPYSSIYIAPFARDDAIFKQFTIFVLHVPTEESHMLRPKHVGVKFIHVLV